MVLVGAEAFAMAVAIIWPLATILGVEKGGLEGSFAAGLVLGVAAAVWIWRLAKASAARNAAAQSDENEASS